MPLITSGKISRAELLQQRLDTIPELRNEYERNLDNVLHYKSLSQRTLKHHQLILKYWREFVITSEDPASMDAEIVPGARLPTASQLNSFVRWLTFSINGSLGQFITKSTLNNYIWTFFACWPRYAGIIVPKQLRIHIVAYSQSENLRLGAKVTTKMREKHVADIVDVNILIRTFWEDKSRFRTNRMRTQLAYLSILSAVSSERPGALVEASGFRHSNEAIEWRDHDFIVIPEKDEPNKPTIAVIVRIRLLKGRRYDESFQKLFFLYPEPDSNRASCPVTMLLHMALEDDIFDGVHTVEEILFPEHAPTMIHVLRQKPEKRNIPVLRNEKKSDEGWSISDSLALPYGVYTAHLRAFCTIAGFPVHITPYCFRRGAAQKFSSELSPDQRLLMMGHNPNSRTFYESYQSRISTSDIQGVAGGRGTDSEKMLSLLRATHMSRSIDPNAPKRLDVVERNALLSEPELVEMREKRQELLLRSRSIVNDDEGVEMKRLRKEAATLQYQHDVIVNRETKARLAALRKEYFEFSSNRQLEGTKAPVPMTMKTAVPEKENPSDPMDNVLSLLYSSSGDERHLQLASVVNALLGLPERPFAPCYPGESPTLENRCPVCNTLCGSKEMEHDGTGLHIHKCIKRQKCQDGQASLNEEYSPRQCAWDPCGHSETTWEDRDKFLTHLRLHLNSLLLPPTRNFPVRSCRWQDPLDSMCEESGCDNWDQHFAEVHAINSQIKVNVEYCYLCAEWFVDLAGDGREWEEHCNGHFVDLFSAFQDRAGDIDVVAVGVVFRPKVDNCIEFEHGTGFNGAQPEFHGHVHSGVALAPMFCPICVYNVDLPIEARMRQYGETASFSQHLTIHRKEIEDGEMTICPVPSCGSRSFTGFDLLVHLVSVHRISICGSIRNAALRRLKLPVAEEVESSISEVSRGKKRNRLEEVQSSWCWGCSRSYLDIIAHLDNAPQTSHCRRVGEYTPVVDGEHKGERIQWTPSSAKSSPSTSKGDRHHQCAKHRKQFHDIREHIPSHCNASKFKIRDPSMKRSQFGPWYDFATWCKSAPPFNASDIPPSPVTPSTGFPSPLTPSTLPLPLTPSSGLPSPLTPSNLPLPLTPSTGLPSPFTPSGLHLPLPSPSTPSLGLLSASDIPPPSPTASSANTSSSLGLLADLPDLMNFEQTFPQPLIPSFDSNFASSSTSDLFPSPLGPDDYSVMDFYTDLTDFALPNNLDTAQNESSSSNVPSSDLMFNPWSSL